MQLICPECRGELQMSGRRTAQCPQHGGEFEVLFDREAEALMKTAERNAIAAEERVCAAHPRQQAIADCGTCGKALCSVCSFDAGGDHYCSDCAVSAAHARPVLSAAFPAGPPPILSPITPGEAPAEWRREPLNLKCAQHDESAVVAQCRGCSGGVCATCDFVFPGDMHFCPECIDKAGDDEVSPRRKKFTTISLVLAVYCTIMFIVMMTGALFRAFNENAQVLGIFAQYGIYIPALIGAGLGWSAHEKHRKNTPLIWTAAVWNGVLVLVIVILEIAWRFQ